MSLGVVLVLALLTTGVTLLASSDSHKKAAGGTTTTTTRAATTTTRAKVDNSKICPLTGTPAPHGRVPRRPALGVKIGNDPSSRPQSGLPDADIVYEEMAEGGITRYLAIFQCHVPAAIGPVRSVRWDDWHVLASYGHPILSFSGGIDQWDAAVASETWLFDANGSEGPTVSAYYRTSNRQPPWNYYTSGKALWALDPNHKPPPQQFSYSKLPATGAKPAVGATIEYFASGSTVQWKWNSALQAWVRFVGGQPDVDVSGAQLRATNVVIETVATQPGPYAESGTTPDVESITEGSGRAWVLTDGKVEKGTWNCPSYGDITRYRFPDGKTMTLRPGNTWVELVPNQNYPVSIQR
ncbi:MAG: DUF3048 domain-containing protein [Acidimicrobiales bacterium]